ncbi:hypothetical protein BAE44_0019863, partial [Dichanthelium oligosanthes]
MASTGHDLLRKHTELELVLQRSARMPITDVSLLQRRKLLERAFKDSGDLLRRCSDIQRYKWLAECANRFLKDVESGCSLRRCIFSNPLVRQLLEGRTLEYKMVQGYRKSPMRCFSLALMLRLSESTDIFGTAVRCLQSFTSSMKQVTEAVIGELTQLPPKEISHSHAASCFSIKHLCSYGTQFWRPDPLCCKPGRCASGYIPSELSCKFTEQVFLIHLECYVSAFECSNPHHATDGTAGNLVGD